MVVKDLNVEISAVMIMMTRMLDKTSVNVLDMYHLIVYIIGLKQQHDNIWKGVQMMKKIIVQQTAVYPCI